MDEAGKPREKRIAGRKALHREASVGTSRIPTEEGSARLHQALEQIRAMLLEAGGDGRTRYVSPSVATVLGYDPEDLLGNPGWERVHQEDLPALVEASRELRATGQPVRTAFRSRHKSGHWVWLEATSTISRAPDGETRTVTLARDVSDMKAADHALRESEGRFRRLTQSSTDLICELDRQGRFLFVSPNSEQILGTPSENLVGRRILDFAESGRLHPDDREGLLAGFAAIEASEQDAGSIEHRLLHADGAWHWFDSRFTAHQGRGREWCCIVVSRDVTLRRRTQEELAESEERYRVLAEASNEMIAETNSEGRLLYSNRASEDVLGFRPEELVGTTPWLLIHPDDMEHCTKVFLEAVETGEPAYLGHYRVRGKDGSWRWLDSQGIPYQRADGELRYLSVTRNVTDQRRAAIEQQELAQRVQQAQRLEGLGVMAGGIAHDFNNLLTPILGDASLALMDLPEDAPVRSRLQKIQKAARRAATLTNQMLAYAGQGPLTFEPLDLSELVREMAQLLESSVGRRAELILELADDLVTVAGDSAQLSQLVMNLLTNAAEAVGETGGHIVMRTGVFQDAPSEEGFHRLGEPLPEGPAVYVEVEDNGCGMDAETLRRIFDPFFTTKFTGRGLGLAAALGIVRGHGGAIELESQAEVGTRFRVVIPASKAARAAPQPGTFDSESWRGSGTVLVIDDDEGVRSLAREALERAGLRVLSAGHGHVGVEVFERHADEIRLVILDRTMPTASGAQVFDAIRRIRRDTPVVLVSGYSEKRAAECLSGRDLAGFLQKPFRPEALLQTVRRAFESPSQAASGSDASARSREG
jgi:PAS domain S-box-containing protein